MSSEIYGIVYSYIGYYIILKEFKITILLYFTLNG